jgi:hypothetical protein
MCGRGINLPFFDWILVTVQTVWYFCVSHFTIAKNKSKQCVQAFTCTFPNKIMVWFMVFNTTFNNISVILWQSALLVEETRVPGENHSDRPAVSH